MGLLFGSAVKRRGFYYYKRRKIMGFDKGIAKFYD
jgi:hypothetical protein